MRTPGTRFIAAGLLIGSLAALLCDYFFYVRTLTGRRLDLIALTETTSHWRITQTADATLSVITTVTVVVALVVIVLIAALRKRYTVAIAAIIIIAGANLTTQVLKKYVFTRPIYDLDPHQANSLPSGHTTVAASIAIALLLAVPVAWRWWIGTIGFAMTVAIGSSTMANGWHRPSDVIAGMLVPVAWIALVVLMGGDELIAPTQDPTAARSFGMTSGSGNKILRYLLTAYAAVGLGFAVMVQILLVNDTSVTPSVVFISVIAGTSAVMAACFAGVLRLTESGNISRNPQFHAENLPSGTV